MVIQNIQDVQAPERTIRQIILPRQRRDGRDSEEMSNMDVSGSEGGQGYRPPQETKRRMSRFRFRKSIWIGLGVLVVAGLIGGGFYFAGAVVTVTARQADTTLDATFTALKDATSADLGFSVMTVTKEKIARLPSDGEEFRETKASGVIIISNNYSAETQRLIKNTRFETPEGRIYRIQNSIVVPGQKTSDGKKTPGVIEVEVVADAAGAEYNAEKTTFTIPGLKGDPRYEGFSVTTKTPLTGGFSGKTKVVSSAAEEAARNDLRDELLTEIVSEARAQIPEGLILFENNIFFEFSSLPNGSENNEVLVTERATLHNILFDSADLAKHIAQNSAARYDGEPVQVINLEDLTFSILDRANTRPIEDTSIRFSLSGSPQIVWTFDEERLKQDLVGKSKRQINTVLSAYPGIEKAEVVIRPFWAQSFPKNVKKIDIVKVGADNAPDAPTP